MCINKYLEYKIYITKIKFNFINNFFLSAVFKIAEFYEQGWQDASKILAIT